MADNIQHEDFGEKIGGAKKDLWKDRGLYVNDLDAMNEREAEKFVKKDNIWKKPDYQAIDGEQKAYEIVVAAAKQWEKQAAATQMINRALSYLRTPEVTHTANEWRKTGNWRNDEEISNRVYRMSCGIWEDTKYDRETKQSVPVAWYVTWDVYVNSPKQGYGEKIAGQNQKRYTDKTAAEKYLEGRKKAYSHLFTEISPQIPKQYEHHFTVYGALLPGYTVEGQEPVKTDRTAADVSEGGISMPEKPEKPSVLGKLSAAKTQEKTSAAPGAANKKKEDLLRKCMEISLLTAFAVLPILAAAAAQKGYILPVCLTLVYTFLGFILLMVNMYLHPLSSMTAIVMRDIPGVVITQPLNIPGAFLCIGVWGVASVLLAGAALKKRK